MASTHISKSLWKWTRICFFDFFSEVSPIITPWIFVVYPAKPFWVFCNDFLKVLERSKFLRSSENLKFLKNCEKDYSANSKQNYSGNPEKEGFSSEFEKDSLQNLRRIPWSLGRIEFRILNRVLLIIRIQKSYKERILKKFLGRFLFWILRFIFLRILK